MDDYISRNKQNIALREQGEWDMFCLILITSTWYGKACYFKQDGGIVYSRFSGKYMTVNDAINEFLKEISE